MNAEAENWWQIFKVINEGDRGEEYDREDQPHRLQCERLLQEDEENEEREDGENARGVGEAAALQSILLRMIEEADLGEKGEGEGVESNAQNQSDDASEEGGGHRGIL